VVFLFSFSRKENKKPPLNAFSPVLLMNSFFSSTDLPLVQQNILLPTKHGVSQKNKMTSHRRGWRGEESNSNSSGERGERGEREEEKEREGEKTFSFSLFQ